MFNRILKYCKKRTTSKCQILRHGLVDLVELVIHVLKNLHLSTIWSYANHVMNSIDSKFLKIILTIKKKLTFHFLLYTLIF